MDAKLKLFIEIADLFNKHGFSLYMVGGSVRDYLIDKPLTDMDLVSDATPEEEKEFIPEASYVFERFGSVKLNYKGVKFDITTLRKETGYIDSRHPNKVEFTKKLKEDVIRRDLTINALYLSKDLKVIDYVDGVNDLNNKLIKIIGDPLTRIQEDPLRIIRIYRFKLELGFDIDSHLEEVIKENIVLVNKLNPQKILEELSKSSHKNELRECLKELGINNL